MCVLMVTRHFKKPTVEGAMLPVFGSVTKQGSINGTLATLKSTVAKSKEEQYGQLTLCEHFKVDSLVALTSFCNKLSKANPLPESQGKTCLNAGVVSRLVYFVNNIYFLKSTLTWKLSRHHKWLESLKTRSRLQQSLEKEGELNWNGNKCSHPQRGV